MKKKQFISFRKSIGFRILGISFILLALPLLVDSLILINKRYKNIVAQAKASLVEAADLRKLPLGEIEILSETLPAMISQFLDLDNEIPPPSEELNRTLKEIAREGNFEGIFLLKKDEEKKFSIVGSGYRKGSYIEIDDASFIFDLFPPLDLDEKNNTYVYFDPETLNPFLLTTYLLKKEGAVQGMIAIATELNSNTLTNLIAQDDDPHPIYFSLLLPSTMVFASTKPDMQYNYFIPLEEDIRKFFEKRVEKRGIQLPDKPIQMTHLIDYPFFEFVWEDEKYLGYLLQARDSNIVLLAYSSEADIFEAPLFAFFEVYGGYAAILILGGILALILTNRMAKPIQNLGEVMAEIQEEKYDSRYKRDSFGFEVNTLGKIFNDTVDAIFEQKKIIEKQRVKQETLQQELRLGQEVQKQLIPQAMPDYPGVELAQVSIPAIEVAGDIYDIFIKKNDESFSLALLIADTSGKGVKACFYSLSFRNIIRTHMKEYDDVAKAAQLSNELFMEETADSGMFVTGVCGTYNYKTKELSFTSCGHNPFFLFRKGGSLETFSSNLPAFGLLSFEEQKQRVISLEKDDVVVFYTDGVTEAHNALFEEFGENRLIELLKEIKQHSVEKIKECILKELHDFVGTTPQHDDITLMILKVVE